MRCPYCGIECRVKAVETDENVTIMFFCRNKKCSHYAKDDSSPEVAEKIIAKTP